jgi:hypothetical protein
MPLGAVTPKPMRALYRVRTYVVRKACALLVDSALR